MNFSSPRDSFFFFFLNEILIKFVILCSKCSAARVVHILFSSSSSDVFITASYVWIYSHESEGLQLFDIVCGVLILISKKIIIVS